LASKDYSFYTTQDFALDESFQNWVLRPDVKSNYFWEAWLREHADKAKTIEKAVELVRSVKYRSYKLTGNEKDELWDLLSDKMDDEETQLPIVSVQKKLFKRHISPWIAAAVVLGAIIAFGVYRPIKTETAKYVSFYSNTGFAEMKKIVLPDSSEVILNANSSVTYKDSNDNKRQVWLQGEAFFHVRHTFDSKKFIVHADHKLSVEVLGTQFDVNSAGQQIRVVLNNGSIKLEIGAEESSRKTQLFLQPGEMLTYNKMTEEFTKSSVDAGKYNAWIKGKLLMNDYTLKDAGELMREVFGKDLVISDVGLSNNKISGSMPLVYNLDTMLVQFEKAFQLHFYKHGNNILVQKEKRNN
jgi:ferric-dicitrate binding protein FerR (iron transport regulator)